MGQMFSLQIPENGGFNETLKKFGSIQRGVSGAATVDTQGARYEFTMSWEDLNEADCSALKQLYSMVRSSAKPVRLISPHRKNLLTGSASSARSVARHRESAVHYFPLSTRVTVTTPEVPRPDLDPLYPLFPRLTRYVHMVNNGTGFEFVIPEGDLSGLGAANPNTRIPVIEGREYTLSCLYRVTAGGTDPTANGLRGGWRREDGDNVTQPTIPFVNLTSATWAWQSVTFTIPTGWPGVIPQICVGDLATIDIGAMQFEEGPVRTPWVMGSGVPVVSFTDLTFTDTLWPLRNAQLTAIEL
jgi:hypothetical protein